MSKSLLKIPAIQALIGRALGAYMLFAGWTTRWRHVNRAAIEPFWRPQKRLIICIWHGRFTQMHRLWAFQPDTPKAHMLISRSREGDVVEHAARAVGAEVIRGSAAKGKQDKGGFEAGRELLRRIEDGGAIALTPDGPRGPRMRARIGPVHLAKIAQAPLLPMAWSTRWRIAFGSWDRMLLPLPFGSGALVWGDPIAPPAPDADNATMEACRLKLEQELNRISAEADHLAGVAAIEPAPARPSAAEQEEAAALT